MTQKNHTEISDSRVTLKYHQAGDTSVLHMYKYPNPLLFAPVFYGNTWGFAEHNMGRKKETAAREAICVIFV